MKKVLSILLAVVMSFSMSVTAFAVEETSVNANASAMQITVTNGVRTVTYSDETTTYIVTYDTLNETICVAQKDIATGVTSYGITVSTAVPVADTQAVTSTIHQDTFSNYEYDIYTGNPNEWNLERPNDNSGSGQLYFKVYENSSNKTELNVWFDDVNALNDKEWEAVAACGLTVVASAAAGFLSVMDVASGGILTPAAITAVITATGATGTGAYLLEQVGTMCNTCRLAYQDVYNATDNMHF
ncbi:MAG: geobacillin-26 family protein [Eubacterium sp.]|nr:geobacillin-26 family protein [Eubacterium sp.]